MTCCQIRQGRDGYADEDIEDYLSISSPCRSTKAATSNEFGRKLDWLGKQQGEDVGVCAGIEKKAIRAERMDERVTRKW